jgi:5-formyltetrahydrofolate cyclo-ligase
MRDVGDTDSLSGRQVVAHLQRWMSSRLPGTVSAYLAMRDEVDVTDLFGLLPGWRWVMPRVEPDGSLSFRDREVGYEIHPLGMRQPVDRGVRTPINEIDVFLVPGVAFDRTGGRLGRGSGYFDVVLTQRRGDGVAIGVVTESRVVDAVPMSDHDRSVDWLATEDGVTPCLAKS